MLFPRPLEPKDRLQELSLPELQEEPDAQLNKFGVEGSGLRVLERFLMCRFDLGRVLSGDAVPVLF